MDLVPIIATYVPRTENINGNSTYVDYIPSANVLKNGISCQCGTRRDCTVFYTNASFHLHITTKKHTEWLAVLNNNAANHYAENIDLRRTVRSQQIIIARMEAELRTRSMTVDLLTEEIRRMRQMAESMDVDDLLEM
jgi:hypothetical protein